MPHRPPRLPGPVCSRTRSTSGFGNPAAQQLPLRDPPGLRQDRQALKPIYTASNQEAVEEQSLEFQEARGGKCLAVIELWSDAWAEFVPFLRFDVEIRKVVRSTNAIGSMSARIRKAVRARETFPSEAAAMKCAYMALMSLDLTGKGRERGPYAGTRLSTPSRSSSGRLVPTAD
ncbi:transposase [Actinomadura sp. WMMB 499]|uniref:transposase n=1 Tax=Actinomadura sp. WMMB 499 TaxID=1219491 RepID=UPI001C3F5772|nr:transposase [Actinomadura sp. WMMB 499]